MLGFVSELREKIALQRQLFNLVFGGNMRKSIASDQREITLADSLDHIKNYNSLKKLIDNTAFEIEIGEDGLLKEKQVDLVRLNAILNEARMTMKVQFFIVKKIKHAQLSQVVFL